MKEQREKERLLPEIDRYRRLIDDVHKQIETNETCIEKENQKTVDLEEYNLKLENQKDDLREEFDGLKGIHNKLKEEPNRLGKGNENL